ncbi:hypothetical protein ACGFNU_09225 [Spirillospora sp. NPDC048911]|uniref:hypothetical protein n=1 Tax=Spirillospora sp. NPDC048911 TaxID=3364527 RepID=UPI0037184E77
MTDRLFIVVRETTADVCRPVRMRVTPPLPHDQAVERARQENEAAMPDIRYTVQPWDSWHE